MMRTWSLLGALGALASAALAGCGSGGAPESAPKLVLLVTVDTLRSDRLGAYGSEDGLTPRLDELAAESEVFTAAYAPSSFTVPSVSTFLTGRYPEQNAVFSNEHILPSEVPTLAGRLAARGYRTGAVVSNFVLKRGTGLNAGFEQYDDSFGQIERVRRAPERIAEFTTRDALSLLDELSGGGEEHVFLWVHYQDPHGPYTPPADFLEARLPVERAKPDAGRVLPFGKDLRGLDGIPTYQRLGTEQEVGYYRAAYDAEVRYTDQEIGRLLDGVRERGLDEDAVILFVADHGESLGERDYWFAHGEYLMDSLVRVPFFVKAPGRAPGKRDDVASLLDVVPTVMPLVGLPVPEELQGRNLLAEDATELASTPYMATLRGSTVPRFALIRDGYKYVATFDQDGKQLASELYRMGEEGENLAESDRGRADAMRAALLDIQKRMGSEGRERLQNRTPEELEMLEKLGYTGGRGH